MTERPSGTVTFLFTDIENSTSLWEEPDTMRAALARHDEALRAAIEANGGWLFKHTGDGIIAAFSSARAAVDAAITAQRKLELPVRMGISTGEVESRHDDYFGPALNRASRITAAGHGGQIVISALSASLLNGVELLDLGEHHLRGFSGSERLFQLDAEGLQKTFPRLRTMDALTGNLPAQATSLIGREQELADIVLALEASRLVTLTGVGGVGKTRLALQVAAEVGSHYRDGVWLIELAPIGDPGALSHAVAGVLGVAQQQGHSIEESLADSLARRRLLLVLDNCEHLIDAVSSLTEEIIARCPEVTLLATSREALMVEGEQSWPVPSLGLVGGASSAAVELFVERARAVVPGFALDGDADTVGEICGRLDGIPLAIELAAARVRSMGVAQIRDRLDERFRLLAGGSRRALERHRTLHQVVQWSFDLLSEAERALLCRLAVFAGGFTLEAAEAVCATGAVGAPAVIDLLDSLVRKSLVTVERVDGQGRYGQLETIRQFGEEQLSAMNENVAARARHAEFFSRESAVMFDVWRSPQPVAAHEWVDREMDNLRAAFRWSADVGRTDVAITIAANIGDMARFRMRHEASDWAAQVSDTARALRHRRLAVLLTWAASNAWALGRLDEAKRYGEEAIALRDDPSFDAFVWAFTDLAMVALYEGDVDRALALTRAGASHEADRHDRMCLACLPFLAASAGRHREAITLIEEFGETIESTGIPLSIGLVLVARGLALAESDPSAALAAFSRALEVARESGNRFLESLAAAEVAALEASAGDPVTALHSFQQLLDTSRKSLDRALVLAGIGGLLALLQSIGHDDAATILYGMLAREFEASAILRPREAAVRARINLGDARFEALQARGAELTLREAVDYAEKQIGQTLAAIEIVSRASDNNV